MENVGELLVCWSLICLEETTNWITNKICKFQNKVVEI